MYTVYIHIYICMYELHTNSNITNDDPIHMHWFFARFIINNIVIFTREMFIWLEKRFLVFWLGGECEGDLLYIKVHWRSIFSLVPDIWISRASNTSKQCFVCCFYLSCIQIHCAAVLVFRCKSDEKCSQSYQFL